MPAIREPDHASALRGSRHQLLQFCSELTDDEWHTPSCADGWRVQDVIAHLGGGLHSLVTPAALTVMRSKDIERTNDAAVDARRDWPPRDVLAEFARWSAVVIRLNAVLSPTPLARVRVRVGELGTFPVGLLLSAALVFDMSTHHRFDLAPAVGRTASPPDGNGTAVTNEWMLAVLANQLRSNPAPWRDRPVRLTLTGPGGGRWSISAAGDIDPCVDVHGSSGASIVAQAEQFAEWATTRAPWRDRDVAVEGDVGYGERFLDSVNIV